MQYCKSTKKMMTVTATIVDCEEEMHQVQVGDVKEDEKSSSEEEDNKEETGDEIEEGKDSTILEKKITIRDPDPKISNDMNSYLVVELIMSLLNGRVRLILNFPVSY